MSYNELYFNTFYYSLQGNQSCIPSFISVEEIKVQARLITNVAGIYSESFGMERLYKDIRFTCNGALTHVVVGTKDNDEQTNNPPEIRLWRRTASEYTQSGPTIQLQFDSAAQDVSTSYLRWYNLTVPVTVQSGDALGIYHYQPTSQADSIIYYQEYSGPVNYISDSGITGFNHYPLVSAIILGMFILHNFTCFFSVLKNAIQKHQQQMM